ncbi:MAG: hypothetical protein EOO92_05060 [Pedobacter sp.]|nr:MAG: hypothetical protein EOO92_05060 [Pedobacter sp.]
MKRIYTFLIVFLAIFFSQDVSAQAKGSVADVGFITGSWKATMPDGQTIEGVWLPQAGENLMGMMRMMRGGKIDLYEILVYEQTENGLVSMVKHFKPGLIGQEEKDKQDRYAFVEASKDKAIFQKEGGSLRILYEKRSATQFVIARGNKEGDKYVYADLFVFNKVK